MTVQNASEARSYTNMPETRPDQQTCRQRIYSLPVDLWVRGFMAMGLHFSVGSTFTLAKTIRDKHEQRRLIGRVSDAKTAKLLREIELGETA